MAQCRKRIPYASRIFARHQYLHALDCIKSLYQSLLEILNFHPQLDVATTKRADDVRRCRIESNYVEHSSVRRIGNRELRSGHADND